MKGNKISILTTRPLAHTTMLKATDAGIEIDTASFIETNNIINQSGAEKIRQLAAQDASVIFTSMNAAEAVIDCLQLDSIIPDWTIYSLGGITQTIIKNYFVDSEIIADAINSTQLAEAIIEDEPEEVVFFCGNQRREELPKLLQNENIKVSEVVVYETIETPLKIDNKYNGILFFSPSAARSFFSINKIDADTVLFAIGTTTAVELRKLSNNKILVGEHPNKEQLAEKAIEYFKVL
ncbi:MAG: uroporphyrinogen-III synthase [Segetibacter sp.]|jgi:uroporphyrinogen-III synthase|nr:uroporphyrinogen-III synthase [Segetibacter sp.]